jgi:hypothetical protein
MGYELNTVDLMVARVQIETTGFEYEGCTENFQLVLDVVTAISPENDRNVPGEIRLIALEQAPVVGFLHLGRSRNPYH